MTVWADALDALVDAAARAALGPLRLSLGRAGTPATRAWLAALTGTERTFAATPAEVAALTSALGRWQADAVAGPVRACFRLVEPDEDDEDWYVRFGLQAADEPSLVVEADAVWRSRGRAACAGPPRRRPARDLPGRAGQGRPAVSRARRRPAHRAAERAAAGHRRRPPLPQHRGADPGHGRFRRPAARLVDQTVLASRAAADRLDPAPARAGRRQRSARSGSTPSPRSATTWPSAARC